MSEIDFGPSADYKRISKESASRAEGLSAAAALVRIAQRGNLSVGGTSLYELIGQELGLQQPERIAAQNTVGDRLRSAREAVDRSLRVEQHIAEDAQTTAEYAATHRDEQVFIAE